MGGSTGSMVPGPVTDHGSRRPSLAPSTLLSHDLHTAAARTRPRPRRAPAQGSDYRAVPAEGRPQSRGSARGEDLKVLRQRAESGYRRPEQPRQLPTLLVRDPAELSPDRTDSKRDPSAKRPVFKPKDISEIEAEIKKINEAEVKAREEAAAEAIAAELEAEVSEASEADLDEITDIIAEEIVAEELENLDKMTDLAAIDMAAEEIAEELLSADIDDLVDLKMDIIADADDSENEIIEGSGQLPTLDFGSITEVTY